MIMKKTQVQRRDFIKKSFLGVSSLLLVSSIKIFAGPFSAEELTYLIPEDKKLSKKWIDSLYAKGKIEVYSSLKDELKYVAMPIGGIACGQLYLSGEGRLRLWHIFKLAYSREKDHGNRFDSMTLGGHYANPERLMKREDRSVDQGVIVKVHSKGKTITKTLDSKGFKDISFRGEYPIGKVEYNDPNFPVHVALQAFSPFIPGNAEESALPATVLEYKIRNTTSAAIEVDIFGWLENAVVPYFSDSSKGLRRNTVKGSKGRTTILSTSEAVLNTINIEDDIVFEDFESGSFENWTVKGKSFGSKPFTVEELADWQPLKGYKGNFFVNAHNTRDVADRDKSNNSYWGNAGDSFTGQMISKDFIIDRKHITFYISGGNHPQKTVLNLVINGEIVRSITGHNSNTMRFELLDVSELIGREAHIEIIDDVSGGWGNIAVDHIVFTDKIPTHKNLDNQHGYGSMALSIIDDDNRDTISNLDVNTSERDSFWDNKNDKKTATKGFGEKLVGGLGKHFNLKAGDEKTVTFLVSWFFPHLNQQEVESGELLLLKDIDSLKRHYFNRFNSAAQVADYVNKNKNYLLGKTQLWNKVWYDSTLPSWLMDRTFIPNDCLATNTVVWFNNGRFWAWEGVECCPGTCQHVWHYAQGMARIFPEIERWLRENIDYGSGLNVDGSMGHRDETAGGHGSSPAHDGHCGTIIRAYREHLMSADYSFLKNNYQNIKKAINFIIREDKDQDGLLEGKQSNTLDASWYGPMGWISSLYLGALAVGKALAVEMNDDAFDSKCNVLLRKGQKNIVSNLFNGEYFIHKPDPNYSRIINSNDGCLIDQVLGQSLADQAGLEERVIPEQECKSALKSIWKYNFAPDAFWYQKHHKPIKGARIYATEGEAGTIMCTWPKGGAERAVPGMASWPDVSETWLGPGGYFDECMNGFEYQVASHMISEGLLQEGLAITKAVHDRYGALKRNPYNEVECGDHYSRSMAAHGVLIAVSGFRYHGPKGEITFKPKLNPEDFKAPFTVAEGWGSYSQKINNKKQVVKLIMYHGQLMLTKINIETKLTVKKINTSIDGKSIDVSYQQIGRLLTVSIVQKLDSNRELEMIIS